LALLTSPGAAIAAPLDTLWSVLPAGFSQANCTANANNGDTTAVAAVSCGQSTVAGGPPSALFYLEENADAAEAQFHGDLKGLPMKVTPCPEGVSSPGTWHLSKANGEGGSIACGIYTNDDKSTQPILMWTNRNTLVLGLVLGGDIGDMYNWWQSVPA
jgi:hypothetical protein